MDKLELLRRIDSMIDFSRATAQLRILMVLNNNSLTIDEIVEKTSLKRKTVLDTLRKLEIKGLVERTNGKYRLSEIGSNIYHALKDIISKSDSKVKPADIPSIKPMFYDSYDELLSVVYMLRCLKVLGRKNKPMQLDKLASKLRVSPITLDSHLSRFTSRNLPVFKRIQGTNRTIYYTLSELGLKLYRTLYGRRIHILKRILYLFLVVLALVIIMLRP